MINQNSLIFSKSAAARILGVKISEISDFRVWDKVCFVTVRGSRPTFVSKKKFFVEFVEFRQQGGKGLAVQCHSKRYYTVASKSAAAGLVAVQVGHSGLYCECLDYQAQVDVLGGGVCKHSYAVLGALGFGSLSDYLSAQRYNRKAA